MHSTRAEPRHQRAFDDGRPEVLGRSFAVDVVVGQEVFGGLIEAELADFRADRNVRDIAFTEPACAYSTTQCHSRRGRTGLRRPLPTRSALRRLVRGAQP